MKKYIFENSQYDLEDKDFFLINAIDNLTNEIKRIRINGR